MTPRLEDNPLEIRSVSVRGKAVSWRAGDKVRMPPAPEDIFFTYGVVSNATRTPVRLRYKLEGYDPSWCEGYGERYLAIRFLNESGEQLTRASWNVSGNSPGWSGDLAGAAFNHRRETVVVPPGATHIQAVITSAGPPATVGIYVVDDLVVSKLSSSAGPATVLLRSPFHQPPAEVPVGQNPPDWDRQGMRPSMAKVVEIGRYLLTRALAILDEDPRGHAEWDSLKTLAPRVNPGDQLLLEWNEVYTMGVANDSVASYEKLPQGSFRFCVAEVTALGLPTDAQASLALRVPLPFWRTPWLWASCAALVIAAAAATGRYLAGRRMRGRMLRLQQERVVEQERLRIAQNLHDDLGARITQISLRSGMSEEQPQRGWGLATVPRAKPGFDLH